MRMRHGLRRWLSSGILLAVLFTQVVATAYACPAQRDADNAPAAQAGMPCADMLAKSTALGAEQAGQCLHHCQIVSTVAAADSGPAVPALAVALATRHFVLAPIQPPAVDGVPWPQRERVHDRVPRLSHSVAHCCYRL